VEAVRRKGATCRYCRKTGLVWRKLQDDWRLFARKRDGSADLFRPHTCIKDARRRARARAGGAREWYP
jgi:hypothetical protein